MSTGRYWETNNLSIHDLDLIFWRKSLNNSSEWWKFLEISPGYEHFKYSIIEAS